MNKKFKDKIYRTPPLQFTTALLTNEKKIIRLLIFISLIMALALPFFNMFVVSPELKRLLIKVMIDESNLTAMQKQIDKLITDSSIFISVADMMFLAIVGIIAYKALNAIKIREQTQKEIMEINNNLEQRVIERTAELYKEVYERREIEKRLWANKEQYKTLSQEFNSLLDAISDIIILVSPDLKVIWANKSAALAFGMRPDDLIGRACYELRFGQNVHCEDCYAIRSFNTGRQEGTEVMLSDKIYDTRAYPIKGDDGAVKNVIIVSKDITEDKQIKNELIRADKLDSIGVIAGGIAHDFNNMLAAISLKIAHAKLLSNPTEKVFAKLADAEDIISAAKALPQQLIAFSKGGISIKKNVSVPAILKASVNMTLSGSACKCELALPNDIWGIEADEGQMIQTFNNILINADHAMPNGGVISITAQNIIGIKEAYPFLTADECVKISVKDEGGGIAPNSTQKIFEPFFTTKVKGNGLGLAIVHSIIKSHNGHISVESKLGEGTAFHIYLPRSEKDNDPHKIQSASAAVYGYKILVMDDEDNIRQELCSILRRRGYTIEEAKDGLEMLNAYKNAMHSSNPFDAVIMDMIIRGGMGGFAAIKLLMEFDPNAKAIVASGYFNEPAIDDFKKYGFSGVIAKPFKIDELQCVLNNIMAGKE